MPHTNGARVGKRWVLSVSVTGKVWQSLCDGCCRGRRLTKESNDGGVFLLSCLRDETRKSPVSMKVCVAGWAHTHEFALVCVCVLGVAHSKETTPQLQ